MGFWNLFERKNNKNKPTKADDRILTQLSFGNVVNIDEDDQDSYIDQGYQHNPTVHAIINTTITMASQVPWKIYKKKPDGTKEYANVPLLQELLDRPNFRDSWGQFVQNAIGYKMLSGNTFIWGVNPDETSLNAGKPQALFVLPSQEMQIWQTSTGPTQRISHYSLDIGGNNPKPIAAEEVAHIRSFQPDYDVEGNFLFGQSPLQAAYRQLVTANDAIETGNSYLNNQGPQTLLTAKHGPDTPSFDQEQAKQLKRQFRQDYQGSGNAGGVLITPMEFNVLSTGMSAADIKLLEQYNISRMDICNVYNFPPLLLGIGTGTYDNQREAKLSLWEDVIIPHLMELRDSLNRHFAYKFGKDICLDYDLSNVLILQERINKQAEAISQLSGVLTLNEARAILGKKPYNGPEGEQLLVANRFEQSVGKPSESKPQESKPTKNE